MKALRLYERLGLLTPVQVESNGYRRYHASQLATAGLISMLRRLDMPLAQVAEVLASLFPRDAQLFRDQAQELADSRWHAGIHFPTDSTVGVSLGRSVGALVVEKSHSDGSQ